jgi:hypothetical protein
LPGNCQRQKLSFNDLAAIENIETNKEIIRKKYLKTSGFSQLIRFTKIIEKSIYKISELRNY